MRAGVLSILGVSLSAVACSALAQDGPRLTADGPWTLVYDDDSCALRRTFGEGDQQGYLEMRRFAPGIGLQVLVASDRLKARDIYSYQYRWGGEPEWREAGRLKITLESGLGGVVFNTALLALPEDSRDFATRQLYMRSTEVREI